MYMQWNNQPLLKVSQFLYFRNRLVRYYWYPRKKNRWVSDTCFALFLHLLWTFNFQIFFHGSFCFVSDFGQKGEGFFLPFFCGGSPGTHQNVGASRLLLLQEFLCEKNVPQNEDKCVIFHPTWWFFIPCFQFLHPTSGRTKKKHPWKPTNQGGHLNKSSTTMKNLRWVSEMWLLVADPKKNNATKIRHLEE